MYKPITKQLTDLIKDVNKMAKEYQQAENAKIESRNNRDWEAAERDQKVLYYDMLERVRGVLSEVTMLGTNCGAIDIREYNKIETCIL